MTNEPILPGNDAVQQKRANADLDSMSFEELMARRQEIDDRLEAMKAEVAAKAEKFGLTVTNGKKKRGRRARAVQSAE